MAHPASLLFDSYGKFLLVLNVTTLRPLIFIFHRSGVMAHPGFTIKIFKRPKPNQGYLAVSILEPFLIPFRAESKASLAVFLGVADIEHGRIVEVLLFKMLNELSIDL